MTKVRYRDSRGRLRTFRGRVEASRRLPNHLRLVGWRKVIYIRKNQLLEAVGKKRGRRLRDWLHLP